MGLIFTMPAVRPSKPLEAGQELVLPLYRPSTLLPPGWLHLPKPRRSLVEPDDRASRDEEPSDDGGSGT